MTKAQDILVKFLSFKTKERILQAVRKTDHIVFQNYTYELYQDIAPATLTQQAFQAKYRQTAKRQHKISLDISVWYFLRLAGQKHHLTNLGQAVMKIQLSDEDGHIIPPGTFFCLGSLYG